MIRVLYQLFDMHHAALTPLRLVAEATQATFRNPFVPASYTGMGRAMAAAGELIERTTRRWGKPEFGLNITHIDGREVAVTEEAALRKPFCVLRHFQRATPHSDPKVLVVAPMSGHYATLLRGTVEALLPSHDVYITDWVDAKLVPLSRGRFDFDDYVEYVMDFIRFLGPDTHVIAVCQPAVPVLVAAAVMAQMEDTCQPRSMTLMGGPIDTRVSPTQVTQLAETRDIGWFERTVTTSVPVYYPGAMRHVYPGFIQLTGFMSMNLDRHVGAHVDLFKHLVRGDGESAEAHRRFYDEYLSVMDLTAEFYLQTVKIVFQDHDLPKGTLEYRGMRVDPSAIKKTALFTVEGELDDISAPGQTVAAHALCSGLDDGMKRHHLQAGVGHYGIFNGRRWREHIMPRVRDFIRSHDRVAVAKPRRGTAV
ncbi:polyhydroxyalkanoate depolymerase [Nitrospirillum amazonense]|uniref:polyhydroxyalkanoate depolymerase n=1 Tax=Nitrospirillum amazonense TaxID=28077 RepID=UPI0024122CC5|nr:polyhydroxyalkanoate depolymerase [Nitrospirillum amazonense]MDG3440582.1 polyhydroxyalkanoate depolymerase [Nitrospirillum amazonense]